MLHSATRKAKLVNQCFKLGLSISYDRVLSLSTKLASTACELYNTDNLVCPSVLRGGIFSVAAVDNIDHNLSSSTAASAFHGTAVSVIQFPSTENVGIDRSVHQSLVSASDDVSSIVLPLVYSNVPPCVLPKTEPKLPTLGILSTNLTNINNCTNGENEWLNQVVNNIFTSECDMSSQITWAGYHAENSIRELPPKPIIAILPLFRHSAHTPAMIRHSFTVVEAAVKHLNPGQIPVLTFDQPLFALAKQIQWHWPEQFGEDKFVILMGGLHIEMAVLRMLGHWLDGSGWVHCLVQANVATSGVADSFLHGNHVKRTRYAHIVTAATLFICRHQSYIHYCEKLSNTALSFDEWCFSHEKSSSQFKYWNTVLQLELTLLSFVHSIRDGNFELYVEILQTLAPWFFCLDQTHYARWLSVHLRDMASLKQRHPDIAA